MSIFTIRPSAVAAAALLAVASVGAQAATQTFSASYGAALTDWSQVINLGKFDTNLGTLNSIVFSLDGTVTGVGNVENKGNAVSGVQLDLSSALTLSRPNGTALVVTNPVFTQTGISLGAYDGTLDFKGTSAYTTNNVLANKVETATFNNITDFGTFSAAGGGTIGLGISAVGTSKAFGSGNISSDFTTQALGKATVTYNYTAAVPEPESYALMLAGLGLMGAVARRRRAAR